MLSQLPHDILAEICSHLGQQWQAIHLQSRPGYYCDDYHTLHRTLVSLSKASRQLHTAVEPRLYSVFSGHAIFDTNLFYRTLQRRPELARHLRILNIDVYQEECWSYSIVPRPPVTILQKTWHQIRFLIQQSHRLAVGFPIRDTWVRSIDIPSTEIWIGLIRLATNLQVLRMYTPQYTNLKLVNAIRDMAIRAINPSTDSDSTPPLSRLQTLSSSLLPIGHRPDISCVDLTRRVSPHDWSCSAMLLPHLQLLDVSYTTCEDPTELARSLHIPLTSLNELRLDNCVFDHTFIQGILGLHPNLRKIELLLQHSEDRPSSNGTRVLQTIISLAPQLEHLILDTRRPYHEHTINHFLQSCPSFRPLENLRTLEIDLSVILNFGLGFGTVEEDSVFLHGMHEILPPSIEALTLLPRKWYFGPRELARCKRRLRAWMGSDFRPPILKRLCVGLSLRNSEGAAAFELGGEMWFETDLGGKGGRASDSRGYEVVRLW